MSNHRHVQRYIDASNAAGYIQSPQAAADQEAAARGPTQATRVLDVLVTDLRRHFASDRAGPYVIDITFDELPNGDWHFDGIFGAIPVSIKTSKDNAKMLNMRTTIRIEDGLYRRAKAAAAEAGRPVGALIEDALRTYLASRDQPRTAAELPTYGGSGVLPGVDLSSNAALREAMDEGVPLDARR